MIDIIKNPVFRNMLGIIKNMTSIRYTLVLIGGMIHNDALRIINKPPRCFIFVNDSWRAL